MRNRLRGKLSYANVMVTILAFVVLCGGAAVAATELAKNSVGARQLRKNSVTSAKVKDGTLRPRDFARIFDTPVGVTGPAGATGPRGPEGPPGPSEGYQAQGSALELGPLGFETVVSLPVPAGPYFATATVEAETRDELNGGIHCRLITGDGPGAAAVFREQAVPKAGIHNLTLVSGFDVRAGERLDLQCYREGPSEVVRVVRANVVAIRLATLSGDAG